MTAHEKDVVATLRRINELSRVRPKPGKHTYTMRGKLMAATLRLQHQLRSVTCDTPEFRVVREQIEAFLFSPRGIALRRSAAAWAKQSRSRRSRKPANRTPRDAAMYGKKGFLSKFRAQPINLDTKRALGL